MARAGVDAPVNTAHTRHLTTAESVPINSLEDLASFVFSYDLHDQPCPIAFDADEIKGKAIKSLGSGLIL